MADVVELCRSLLRIDTSNPGHVEEPAARFVVDTLAAAGVAAAVVESERGRTTVLSRVRGADPSLPGLIVHGHLDVVPAQHTGWTHDPFGAHVDAGGMLWGRGALDMKNTVAMMLATQLELAGARRAPRRNLLFAYFADEERGGELGSKWLVDNRPELFEGFAEALGEVGGFSVTLPDGRRLYPLQVAERGFLWAKITARGPGGHAAMTPPGTNPAVRLAEAIGRIAALRTDDPAPVAAARFRDGLAEVLGGDPDGPAALGSFGPMSEIGASTSFVPTVVHAGVKTNVIPDVAELLVDCRLVPGGRDNALAAIRGALDEEMELEVVLATDGAESPVAGPLPAACAAAIAAADPHGVVLPFVMPAGTDAQHLARLGIRGYGFVPLPLPAGFEYPALFHAANERVPVESLRQGQPILRELVASY